MTHCVCDISVAGIVRDQGAVCGILELEASPKTCNMVFAPH